MTNDRRQISLMNSRSVIYVILLLMMISGCSPVPKGIPEPEQMAQMLADFHTGEAVAEIERRTFDNDSMRLVLRKSILAKHNMTEEQYDSAVMWYGRNMDYYAKVYERVVSILDSRLMDIETRTGGGMSFGVASSGSGYIEDSSAEGDSVDVWQGMRSRIFSTGQPTDVMPFRMFSDAHWERGDIYTLNAKISGGGGYLTTVLAMEYTDGTTDYLSLRSIGNGHKEYSLHTDTAKVPRMIYGLLSYTAAEGETVVVDSVSLMRSRFGSKPRGIFRINRFDNHR